MPTELSLGDFNRLRIGGVSCQRYKPSQEQCGGNVFLLLNAIDSQRTVSLARPRALQRLLHSEGPKSGARVDRNVIGQDSKPTHLLCPCAACCLSCDVFLRSGARNDVSNRVPSRGRSTPRWGHSAYTSLKEQVAALLAEHSVGDTALPLCSIHKPCRLAFGWVSILEVIRQQEPP